MSGGEAVRRSERAASPFADEAAFSAWYREAVGRVYAFLFARTGGDPALAEELTQQTFIAAVRARDTFDGRADPLTWALAIARNKLIDHARRRAREERRRLRLIEVAPGEEDAWHATDRRRDVGDALRSLPEPQRLALLLHHVDGLPVREVADALGRSQAATESLLVRARGAFRRAWEGPERG